MYMILITVKIPGFMAEVINSDWIQGVIDSLKSDWP